MNRPVCPLCGGAQSHHFHEDKKRNYWRCPTCCLVFVEPSALPGPQQEKAEYEQHQNNAADRGYRTFLERIFLPLNQRLPAHSSGLDFGCGPGPALAAMFEDAGHAMAIYDPYFANQPEVLARHYDFITCTEAIEHFHQPAREWALLLSMLRSGGYLAIMTKLVISAERFANWHYKQDPTHVSFFSKETF